MNKLKKEIEKLRDNAFLSLSFLSSNKLEIEMMRTHALFISTFVLIQKWNKKSRANDIQYPANAHRRQAKNWKIINCSQLMHWVSEA